MSERWSSFSCTHFCSLTVKQPITLRSTSSGIAVTSRQILLCLESPWRVTLKHFCLLKPHRKNSHMDKSAERGGQGIRCYPKSQAHPPLLFLQKRSQIVPIH